MASNTSLSPGDNSSPRCRLLELPREIRDRIYKYAVRCRRAIHKHHDQTFRHVIEDSRVPLPGSLCNLLLANRQIYKEATECLYRCNWIRFAPNPLFFRPPFQLLYAIRQHLDIPSEHFSLLTNVTVTGVYSDPEAFPDVPFTASFSHFLKHVAPELESLRRLCLLVPTAMVSSRVHCMCEVMSEAACRCRMAFTVTEERYRTLYDQLQNLEHHNMSRDRSPLQFRFMAGSSNTSESVAPIPYPDRCPQINIGPGRVFEVYDLLMFAHLLLQLELHLSCTECDETDYGYMERRFFDFKLVEKQPAESQDMVLKHDHCPGWDKVRKHKNYSERIEKRLEKYCDIVKEIRAERQGSNSWVSSPLLSCLHAGYHCSTILTVPSLPSRPRSSYMCADSTSSRTTYPTHLSFSSVPSPLFNTAIPSASYCFRMKVLFFLTILATWPRTTLLIGIFTLVYQGDSQQGSAGTILINGKLWLRRIQSGTWKQLFQNSNSTLCIHIVIRLIMGLLSGTRQRWRYFLQHSAFHEINSMKSQREFWSLHCGSIIITKNKKAGMPGIAFLIR